MKPSATGLTWVAVAFTILFAGAAFAQSATLQSDQPDYAPGATAILTGAGFGAGEQVVLQVHHADATPDSGADHEPWTVTRGGSLRHDLACLRGRLPGRDAPGERGWPILGSPRGSPVYGRGVPPAQHHR